jgi:hypothetical protein
VLAVVQISAVRILLISAAFENIRAEKRVEHLCQFPAQEVALNKAATNFVCENVLAVLVDRGTSGGV